MKMPGGLITFEGVEGSGKSTQILQVSAWLARKGLAHIVTREPGGTPIGQNIRQILLDFEPGPTPMAELLLYYADRWQHVEEIMLPAVGRGELVLTDRYYHSSLAYQGYGRGLDLRLIRRLNRPLEEKLSPIRAILFDLPAEQALNRIEGERDRLEGETLGFHQQVREGYLRLAASDTCFRIVDASEAEGVVFEEVKTIFEELLDERGV